ncbi:hypothetical protein JCM3765_006136 [Sporobolomyces pararoseus]
MGVRDLFPSLKKLVPRSIKPLESLSHLPRSKFAIDGNLLTTKFHFSPSSTLGGPPPSNRHVKSWYSFLRELEKRQIEAVVIFDGEGRKLEKERERQRRKDARELQRMRGEAEEVRTERLRSAKTILEGNEARSRKEANEERDETAIQAARKDDLRLLQELRKEYEKDKTNPLYSKNQELITEEEGQFYDSIFHRQTAFQVAPPPDRRPGLTSSTAQAADETVEPLLSPRQDSASPETLPTSPPTWSSVEPQTLHTSAEPTSRVVPSLPPDSTQELPLDSPEALATIGSPPSPRTSLAYPSTCSLPSFPLSNPVVELLKDSTDESDSSRTKPLSTPSTPSTTFRDSAATPSTSLLQLSLPPDEIPPSEPLVEVDLNSLIQRSSQLSKSHLSRSVSVPSHVFSDVKALVSSMGYPILTPSPSNPFEAESICSLLYHESSLTGVTHVVSEDTDVLVYSAPLLRRITTVEVGMQERKKRKGYEMSVTDPIAILEGLELDREEFTDWCLMCGTDFTERIPGLGPVKALSLIRKYRSIENIFANENLRNKYFPPPPTTATEEALEDEVNLIETYEEWMQRIKDAREIFLRLPELSEVIRDGEAMNLCDSNTVLVDNGVNGYGSNEMERSNEDDKTYWETAMDSKWFDKKEEKKEELERLKRRFGIDLRWKEPLSNWFELQGEEEEDIYEEVFDEDEFSSEDEFFERYREPEGVKEMDERAADVWLREHEDTGVQ